MTGSPRAYQIEKQLKEAPVAQVDVVIVDAFVREGMGGNPAGVVLEADRWSPAPRQAIAAGLGLSETAFVGGSEAHDLRLAFFTPTRAIPHCGHATIAAVSLMAAEGLAGPGILVNETVDGPRRLRVAEGQVFLEQPHPSLSPLSVEARNAWLQALGLRPEELLEAPVHAHNGNGSLLVPLRDRARLASLDPDMAALASLSEGLGLVGVYAFALSEGQAQAEARMFGPAYGIPEEAATGMMAGPLGFWLARRAGIGGAFRIAQGHLMAPPSPSLLEVQVEKDSVWVGGAARVGERRTLMI